MLTNSPKAEPLQNTVQILTAGSPPPSAVLFRVESLGFVSSTKATQGVPIVGFTEMDVVDPNAGKGVKRDGVSRGEVVLRGGCVMLGYFKDPLGTSKCMKDGWFYTGDVGVMHPDGYLEVKDSVEIDSVLYSHPAVNEAAVVARPDEFWGETPCAFVSLEDGFTHKPDEKDIIDYCREKMAYFMAPKTVVFKDELPKTSNRKIQKYLLREYAKDSAR
ncbi:unnamed protein product [Dovyalis caffra]|uniref:AMP-binding enzyme C-terminal domain-containing protein n=1 Tax=Dovyalis caffra TaxID=77055 RepID=A0AAV1S4J3_9ROSI|nr:unnamed protein product [Dovyalis caffra]